jgi:hypothetical protein
VVWADQVARIGSINEIQIASLDGEELDYLCVSLPDGGDLETYASRGRADCGEIVDFFIEDDKVETYVLQATIGLVRIDNGKIDFIADAPIA